MVAQMHPRSRTTMGLFGTTLAVSFLVVGLPHILPCPVPRTSFSDAQTEITEDGRRRRRRRVVRGDGPHQQQQQQRQQQQQQQEEEEEKSHRGGTSEGQPDTAAKAAGSIDATLMDKGRSRECPVPKPGGIVGQILGFGRQSGQRPERVEVQVEERK